MNHPIPRRSQLFLIVPTVIACVLATPVAAEPISLTGEFNFREVRNTLPLDGLLDLFQVGADVVPVSAAPGTTVSATNSATGDVVAIPFLPGPLAPDQFDAFLPFDSAQAAGSWSFSADNGGDSATGFAAAIGATTPLPFMVDLAVSGGLTPTFTWIVPDLTGIDVDRIRVRVQNASGTLFSTGTLALTTTSFTIPGGVITGPGTYYARILLEDTSPTLRNRSSTLLAFTVPEPGTAVLAILGLAAMRGARRSQSGAVSRWS